MKVAAFVALSLFACAPPRAAGPARDALAAAPTRVAAPVPASAPHGAAPLPPALAGANAEHVRLLGSICATAYVTDEKGQVHIGCTSHPPFVDPAQLPNGTMPAFTGDPLQLCRIAAVHRGSFSRPSATEAVVAFDSCWESGSSFDTSYANAVSVVLLEEVGGRWQMRGYEASIDGSSCWVGHAAKGPDSLVCEGGLGATRIGEISYFFALDFTKPKDRATTVARLYADLFECEAFGENAYRLPNGFVSLRVGSVQRSDLDGDGAADLQIDVLRARTPPGPGLAARARRACAVRSTPNAKGLVPSPTKSTLAFTSRAGTFEPSPATRALLDTWTNETQHVADQLRGAAPP